MTRRHHDHAIESLRAALKGLRTRSGLTVERLRATELSLGPLLDLDVVAQLEETHRLSPEEAVVAAVRGAAAQLDVTDLLIVDAALALGLLDGSGPDAARLDGLYAPDLSERRTVLATSWSSLLQVAGADRATPAPTVRALRTDLESRAFERLADRLLALSPLDALPEGRPVLVAAADAGRPAARTAPDGSPRVFVAGAAVIDHILVVDHVPEPGTAVQATSYESLPGGKGLNQAVAAARLGMEAHLLTTVGDDEAGRRLLAYLRHEGVDTDLIRVVPGGTTPVTTVIVTPDGTASTVGWTNHEQIGVTIHDLRSRSVRAALHAADAVLLTFEPARDTVDAVLAAAGQSGGPTVLLTPSPPSDGPRFAHESLRYVDYLVGTQWELSCLLPSSPPDTPSDRLSRQLLVLGAGTVCVAEGFGCAIRSNTLSLDVSPPPTAFREAPGARDAFTAALALRLHRSGGRLDEADARWATAAMAASQTFRGVASSMPAAEEIDRILALAALDTEGTSEL